MRNAILGAALALLSVTNAQAPDPKSPQSIVVLNEHV
jgi:hypothetical protein